MSAESKPRIVVRSLLQAWCQRSGCSPTDPRLGPLVDLLPPDMWRDVLAADEGVQPHRVVLRRLGDPTRVNDEFWRHVRATPGGECAVSSGGVAPESLAGARLSMRLSDLLVALRLVDRSDAEHRAGIAKDAAVERARVADRRAQRELDAERRAVDENGNFRTSRLDRLQERLDDGDLDEDDDENDPDALNPERAVSELAQQGEDEAEAIELDTQEEEEVEDEDYGDEPEYEPDEPDEPDDPIGHLLRAVAGHARGVYAVYASHRALPAEIVRRAAVLAEAGCPKRAAWFLAQADAELDASVGDDLGQLRDHAGVVTLLAKGLETALQERLLQEPHRGWDNTPSTLRPRLDSILHALDDAVRGRGGWPTGIPFVHGTSPAPRLLAEVALWPSTRLAWIAAGIHVVAAKCRNGFVHSEAAKRDIAENFRGLLLGPGGFIAFLTSDEPAPSMDVQAAIWRLHAGATPLDDQSQVWLSATPAHWVTEDSYLYEKFAAHNPIPEDPGALEKAVKARDIVYGEYDRRHEQSSVIWGMSDHGDVDYRNVLQARDHEAWPLVHVAVRVDVSKGPTRTPEPTLDRGALLPQLSTLRWRVPTDQVIIEWWSSGKPWTERLTLVAFRQSSLPAEGASPDAGVSPPRPNGTESAEERRDRISRESGGCIVPIIEDTPGEDTPGTGTVIRLS